MVFDIFINEKIYPLPIHLLPILIFSFQKNSPVMKMSSQLIPKEFFASLLGMGTPLDLEYSFVIPLVVRVRNYNHLKMVCSFVRRILYEYLIQLQIFLFIGTCILDCLEI